MKFARLLVLLMMLSAIAPSCRKGPEDPLLSLRTRKARISNDWHAYSYIVNGVERLRANTTTNINQGDCGTQIIERYDSLEIFMSFNKSGEYKNQRYSFFEEESS